MTSVEKNLYSKQYREKNKESLREKRRLYCLRNKEIMREKRRKRYPEIKNRVISYLKEYRKTDHAKDLARARGKYWRIKNKDNSKVYSPLRRAILRGEIIKGHCMVCGSNNVQAHHEDYAKPLEVMWLCGKHHRQLHRTKRENYAYYNSFINK